MYVRALVRFCSSRSCLLLADADEDFSSWLESEMGKLCRNKHIGHTLSGTPFRLRPISMLHEALTIVHLILTQNTVTRRHWPT